jgi:hypothetical protein
MPTNKKRLVLYLGDEHIAVLKRELARTGVPMCEQVRRLILPPVSQLQDFLEALTK